MKGINCLKGKMHSFNIVRAAVIIVVATVLLFYVSKSVHSIGENLTSKINTNWSKQIEINILNTHSSPAKGENWVVRFTTKGRADLRIIPDDEDTVRNDEFVALYCGDQKTEPQILEMDVIYYPDWECNEAAKVVHYTLKTGPHTLRFEFGEETAYAYNTITTTVVYVASQKSDGSIGAGGRAGVDAFCSDNQPGPVPCKDNIHALMSVNEGDAVADMPANYGYLADEPLKWAHSTTGGLTQFASSWADALDVSITVNRQDGTGDNTMRAWTGSNRYGAAVYYRDCLDWTYDGDTQGGSGFGGVGYGDYGLSLWIGTDDQYDCRNSYSVMCACEVECEDDYDCGLCEECTGGSCVNQPSTADDKNECDAGWDACWNQYQKRGPDGFCDGAGACDTDDASAYIVVGDVCQSGNNINPNGNSNCGTGAQACYCDNDWYQCDTTNDCTYDRYYVGFNNGPSCIETDKVLRDSDQNNPSVYRCNTGLTTAYASYASIMDTSRCSETDNCLGNTRYTGSTCSGGSCGTPNGDIGCCQGNYCSSTDYCKEADYTCYNTNTDYTCAERNENDFGVNTQESSEDLWDECGTTTCYTDNCTGGSYACGVYSGGEQGSCNSCYECNDGDSACDDVISKSSDWNIDCSDNCVISSNVAMNGNKLLFSGSGAFNANADITDIDMSAISSGCKVVIANGYMFG